MKTAKVCGSEPTPGAAGCAFNQDSKVKGEEEASGEEDAFLGAAGEAGQRGPAPGPERRAYLASGWFSVRSRTNALSVIDQVPGVWDQLFQTLIFSFPGVPRDSI